MKITAIKQQAKHQDRYSIFIDGQYTLSLSESTLLEQKLASGQSIDKTKLKEFKKISADDKAYSNALRYITIRQRSIWEMTDYLRRKQVEEPTAKAIITKLTSLGLLDDEKFAQTWVENRRLLKAISRRRLSQELRQKRIAKDIIEKVTTEDSTDEQQTLRDLVAKKLKQGKYFDDRLKLMQYLSRQGFNYDDIKTVMNEFK